MSKVYIYPVLLVYKFKDVTPLKRLLGFFISLLKLSHRVFALNVVFTCTQLQLSKLFLCLLPLLCSIESLYRCLTNELYCISLILCHHAPSGFCLVCFSVYNYWNTWQFQRFFLSFSIMFKNFNYLAFSIAWDVHSEITARN